MIARVMLLSAPAVLGLVALSFFYIVAVLVFTDGQCCSDDSVLSVAAKNLAFGAGYSTSISHEGIPGIVHFSRDITTGPVLILPAAGMIAVIGNEPWVPGLTSALFSVGCFMVLFICQAHFSGIAAASSYTTVLIALSYLFTTQHFEHWFALLGEMPAALTCILAASILARPSRPMILVASLLFGLAIMIKLLAALSAIPFFAWLLWRARGSRRELIDLFLAMLLFLMPAGAFQAWQVASLGPVGYAANLKVFWSFVLEAGAAEAGVLSHPLDLAAKNVDTFQKHFNFSIWLLPLAGLMIVPLCWLANDAGIRRTAALLLGAVYVHLLWWIAFSPGWPRYILIGLLAYAAALATIVYARPAFIGAAILSAVVVLFALANPLLTYPYQRAIKNGWNESDRVQNLRRTTKILAPLPRPFVTNWTGTAADIEYMLPTVANFIRFDKMPAEVNSQGLIVAYNKQWLEHSADFDALLRRCADIFLSLDPYVAANCRAQSARPHSVSPR